jgi:hypothetical protein
MRKFSLLLVLLLTALPVGAQVSTLVTGTVTDPNGLPYSNAAITAQLIPSTASPTITVGGRPIIISGLVRSGLDLSGSFSMGLFCNSAGSGCSVISPAGTQWQFTVTTIGVPVPWGTGPQAFSVTLTITGASQSITSNLNAAAPALTHTLSGTSGPIVTPSVTSSSANPASTGFIRLEDGDCIEWRNHANNADVPLCKNTNDDLTWPNFFQLNGLTSNSANPASPTGSNAFTNVVRLNKQDNIAFRSGDNASDILLHMRGASGNLPADTFGIGDLNSTGVVSNFFISNISTQATNGTFRMPQNDPGVCWRNQANGGNNCITEGVSGFNDALNLSSNFTLVQGKAFQSAATFPGAAGQVRLGNTDTINFRNNGNTADDVLGVSTGDQLTYAANVVGFPVFCSTTLGANVSGSTTNATVTTLACTMPATGCPCRVSVVYTMMLNFAASMNDVVLWVDDGLGSTFAVTETGPSNASSGADTSAAVSDISPTTYANGAAVTFTLKHVGTNAGYTLLKNPRIASSGPSAAFRIAVVPSA